MSALAKLRWQCRRGTLELDWLLSRYLDARYLHANREEQTLFVELLTFEDDVLLDLLIAGTAIPPPHLDSLVYRIRYP